MNYSVDTKGDEGEVRIGMSCSRGAYKVKKEFTKVLFTLNSN